MGEKSSKLTGWLLQLKAGTKNSHPFKLLKITKRALCETDA